MPAGGVGQICNTSIAAGTLPIALLVTIANGTMSKRLFGNSQRSSRKPKTLAASPASFSAPVIANRHETSSNKGQSIAAIIVRLVILRLARSSAGMIKARISRDNGGEDRTNRETSE